MPDPTWVAAARKADLPEEGMLAVFVRGALRGFPLLLVRHAGELHALENRCPHEARPLSDGVVEDHAITCPTHGWRFDVRTGEMVERSEVKVTVYPVRIQGDTVLVGLPAGGAP